MMKILSSDESGTIRESESEEDGDEQEHEHDDHEMELLAHVYPGWEWLRLETAPS